jgi:hypothetical protein
MIQYLRHKLIKWLNVDEDSAYLRGLETGTEGVKRTTEDIIERKAASYFCQQNHYVDPRHIFDITPNSNIPYINQEPVTKDLAKQLKSEADLLTRMYLWELLQGTLKQRAVETAIKTSTEWDHVVSGKSMLHCLGIIQSIVKRIESLDLEKIPEGSGKETQKML